jgi:hypothetical protein
MRAVGAFVRQLHTGAVSTTANVTAGTINGATVGATTPSTGAFTTLSASGRADFGTGTGATTGLAVVLGSSGMGTGYGALYSQSVTPSATNYSIGVRYDASALHLNATTQGFLKVNDSSIANWTSTGLSVTGALSASSDFTQSGASARTTYSSASGNGGLQNDNGSAYALLYGSTHATLAKNVVLNSDGGVIRLKSTGTDIATVNAAGLAVTGALSATGNATLGDTTASDVTLQIGPTTPVATRSSRIAMTTSSTQKNWFIAHNWNTTGGLEFTQSTAAGGSTMGATPSVVLDASGNLFVGATANVTSGGIEVMPNAFGTGQSNVDIGHITGTPTTTSYQRYIYNGTVIGNVAQSGTTAVLYNTTSDYRLKTVIAPVSGAGARIDALNPVEYEWKADGTRTRGFLAHEFQAVYAQSVNGSKDEVDAEGNPKYQSMQAGSAEVIADLVAEIKSLRARLNAAGIA